MRRFVFAAIVGVVLGASPATAQWEQFHQWDFCTANGLSVCMDFQIMRETPTSDNYRLRIEYVGTTASLDQSGMMTSAGIYRSRRGSEDLNVSNLAIHEIDPSTATWSLGSNQLNGDGPIVIEVAGNSDNGINNGLPVSGFVVLSFRSTNLAGYDMSELYARSHIQGFGENGCSLKPDSHADGNVVDGADAIDERCGVPTEVVPEPITLVLLGSGLAGIAGVRRRRRLEGDASAEGDLEV